MDPTEAAARLAFMLSDTTARGELITALTTSKGTPDEAFFYLGTVVGHLVGIIDILAAEHPNAAAIAHELTVSYEIDDFARGMAEATDLPPTERNEP